MLIDATTRPDHLEELGLHRWENGTWAILWKGFVFSAGQRAGPPTIAHLAEQLAGRNLASLAQSLRGVFALFVFDKRALTWRILVDNGGLYRVYHDARGAGSSFLEMTRARSCSAADLDPTAVMSYLASGYVFGPATIVRGIRKLRADQVLVLAGDTPAPPRIEPKRLVPAADVDAATVVERYFADLAHAVQGRRLSVDATGGFDTRLNLCLLHACGASFEMAVSSAPDSPDKRIAERIAGLLRHEFVATGHDIEHLEEELPATFADADGQADLRHFHRNRQNVLGRRARGIETLVHGGGGEVFRDYFFAHDFPFYGTRRTNFERYYDLRIATVRWPEQYFGPAYRPLIAAAREASLRQFADWQAERNHLSCNRVAYFLRAPEFFGPFFSSYVDLGVEVVAPFLDYDVAMAGMRLSPWQGFYNRWHRAELTRHNPELAALPTSEGYSASNEIRHLPADLFAYGLAQASRVGKKLGQRALGKTLFHRVGALASDAPGYAERLRQTPAFVAAVERLKRAEVLAPELVPDDLREAHCGRVLTLGMLLGHFEGDHGSVA